MPGPESWTAQAAGFTDSTFRTILFSVFAGATSGPLPAECLRDAVDEESFAQFVIRRFRQLDPETVRRVIRVACRTYGWNPAPRRIAAPVTIFKARGDEESFLERAPSHAITAPMVVHLDTDHYGALREPGVDELTTVIQRETRTQSCHM